MVRKKEIEQKSQLITFKQLQDVQEHFVFQNGLENVNTQGGVLVLLTEEVYECCEALEKNDQKEIKGELADIFIFAANVASEFHFDIGQAILGTVAQQKLTSQAKGELEISTLQRYRKSGKRRSNRLVAQESVDLLLQADRATQAYSIGKNESIQTAIAELVLVTVDVANSRNINLQVAVNEKMGRNFAKYNPFIAQQLIASGLTPQEAHDEQKIRWDRTRDKDFLK